MSTTTKDDPRSPGDPVEERLEQRLAADPKDASAHRAIAEMKQARGDELGRLAHLIAAQTLEAHVSGRPAGALTELGKVATGYFMKGDHGAAERWYRLMLMLDPDLAVAHQNLAAIHAARGELAEADACRQRAYAIQRVFIETAETPLRQLLILCAGRGAGNVPFETLLSTGRSDRIKYVIDFADEEEDAQLPRFDLVFNAVGEPDVAATLAARLARFAARCGRPVLNEPVAVARTQRHLLPALGRDLDAVAVASCSRHDGSPPSRAELRRRLRRHGLALPVLARPAASHGGKGLVRCESLDALDQALREIDGAHYLTAFHDVRSADGHWRKYRIVFVDRQPYAYHLAISSHWMVHYFSANMEAHAWKLDEERRFLDDPRAALGDTAMAAIAAIGRQLDLDYAGIDFTILPDGQLFVFEANATMLVHFERSGGALEHRNAHVQRIVDAFDRLLASRTPGPGT
jgi:tetratricopeptide (TPR) repeat protein